MYSIVMRAIAVGWSAMLITLIGFGAMSQGRFGTVMFGPGHDILAMTIAISNIEFGLKEGLGYREVEHVLTGHLTINNNVNDMGTLALVQQPDLVTKAIKAATKLKKEDLRPGSAETGGYATIHGEDIGYADFYNLAFRIFGYDSRSTSFLYMTILAAAFALYVFTYWRDNFPIGVLTLGITALFLETTSSSIISIDVPSVAANRFLSTLALIPLLHIVAAIINSRELTAKEISTLILQIMIMVFAISCRSSAQWAALAILFIAFSFGIKKMPVPRLKNCWQLGFAHLHSFASGSRTPIDLIRKFTRLPRLIVVPTLLLLTLVSANLVEKVRLHPIYFGDDVLPHHMLWHSAYLGLSLHPQWAEHLPMKELAGKGGDGIPFTLSMIYLRDRGIPYLGGATGNDIRIPIHERVIRSAFFNFLKHNPWYCVQLYFYYKPISFLEKLKLTVRPIPLFAWMLAAISIITSIILLMPEEESTPSTGSLIAASIVFFTSLLPLMWAYPACQVMADQLWSSLFFVMFLFVYLTVNSFQKLLRKN